MVLDKSRVEDEIRELCEEEGYEITYLPDIVGFVFENYTYPRGWRPRTAPLLIRLAKFYPRMQPAAYIPKNLTYHGPHGPPTHLVDAGDLDSHGWVKWCIHEIEGWDPEYHDIRKFTDLLHTSLKRPNSDNPVQEARSDA